MKHKFFKFNCRPINREHKGVRILLKLWFKARSFLFSFDFIPS